MWRKKVKHKYFTKFKDNFFLKLTSSKLNSVKDMEKSDTWLDLTKSKDPRQGEPSAINWEQL